jgi:hypothetical protein
LGAAFTSCDEGDGRATDGPLVALVGSGGNSLDAPPGRARWTGTFGSLLVCTNEGVPVEIDSVSYHFVVRPVAARALIRKAPALAGRRAPLARWRPLIALRGPVERLRREGEVAWTSLQAPPGVEVENSCDQDGPDDARTELVTSMTTDRRGGWIDQATIAYTSGGRDYELDIHWTYITCGTAINELWTDDTLPAPCARPRP